MRRLLFILAIFSGQVTEPIIAQACGGGTFTFEFYVLNGEKPKDLVYEVFPVIEDSERKLGGDIYSGLQLDSASSVKIMDKSTVKLDQMFAYRGNKKQGEVKGGILQFATAETAYYPCLLKVSSGNTRIYILANLIGGCNRSASVLWGEYPKLAGR